MILVIVKASKKLVVINENCSCTDDIGVVDEANATLLKFDFPKIIDGIPIEQFKKEIIFQNASCTMSDELTSDVFKLAKKHTKYPQIRIQVKLTTSDMEWISFPTTLTFAEHLTATAHIKPEVPPFNYDEYAKKDEIPTKTSQLENDSGFITATDIPDVDIDLSTYATKDDLPELDVDDFVEKTEASANLYKPETEGWVDNAVVNQGLVMTNSTYADYCVTPYISLSDSASYSASKFFDAVDMNKYFTAAPYNENKHPIQQGIIVYGKSSICFSVPNESVFIRLTVKKSYFLNAGETGLEAVIRNFNSAFMLIEGEVLPDEYIPYRPTLYSFKDNVKLPIPEASGGKDGISPTVSIVQIEGGNCITIVDVNGPHSVDVMNGADGKNGLSAYQIAVNNGFAGTEEEWLESLNGSPNGSSLQPLVGTSEVITPAQIKDAVIEGRPIALSIPIDLTNAQGSYVARMDCVFNNWVYVSTVNQVLSNLIVDANGVGLGKLVLFLVGEIKDGAYVYQIIPLPTKVSQLENDSKFLTEDDLSAIAIPHIDEETGNWFIGNEDTGISAKGIQGPQGETGPVGPKGNDGYTPQKGVDYFDGENGTSVTVSSTQTSTEDGGDNIVTFSDGKTLTVKNGTKGNDGYTPKKGTDYFDGQDGKDGISVTHSWNGTTLNITSANGTTSANLKGEKGEKGDTGAKGDKGATGQTGPQGSDGTTPHIGNNGNWFIGATDTGVSATGVEQLPSYVTSDTVENVIDNVIAAQTGNIFTFAAVSDLHYGHEGYTNGIKHACQALKYIDSRVKLDMVAVLGDFTDGYPGSNLSNAKSDFKAINSLLNDLRFAPNMRIMGNHDYYADNMPIINRFIQSYSDNVMWGNRTGGYFYRDFYDYKLRVICVNTEEIANEHLSVSNEQYIWFTNVIDLSEKEDAAEWQILILSHKPVDWGSNLTNGYQVFTRIIYAYNNSLASTHFDNRMPITFDFSKGNNTAKIIANIHGHIHNLMSAEMYVDNGQVSLGTCGTKRIATPEACYGRANNSYPNSIWEEAETYPKIQNTVNDTSFCIYCIDLDDFKVKSFCYGAGYDRNISYVNIIRTFSVTNTLTNVTSNNSAETITEGEAYSATLTPDDGCDLNSVIITMDGLVITDDVYDNGNINIASVTGDILIVAVADTNLLKLAVDNTGAPYNNGQAWKANTRLSSSGGESSATGMEVTGFIPVKVGETLYLKNISMNMNTSTDGTHNYRYLALYKSDFTNISSDKVTTIADRTNAVPYTTDADGNLTSITVAKTWTNYAGKVTYTGGEQVYLRFSANEITNDSIITINELIE